MTTQTKLVNELVNEYKKTLDVNSKWYSEDLHSFKAQVSKLSASELKEKLERMSFMNGKTFAKQVSKEVRLMDKSGMFEAKKLGAYNALS